MYEIGRYYRVNVQGTALLFDVLANAQSAIGNFVLASSRSVYGEGAYICGSCDGGVGRRFPPPRSSEQLRAGQWEPVCADCNESLRPTATREDDALNPASIYAATKLAQEELVRTACGAFGIASSILRLQNVFGEGQSLRNPYTGILSIFSTRIRLGLSLPVFEDGKETRDFVHVQDVVAAIVRCLERPNARGATLNVGSGKASTIFSVASMLSQLIGSGIPPHVSGEFRIGDIRHNWADLSRLEQVAGLRPQVSIDEGLRRFSRWVETQPIPEDLLERANAQLKSRNLMS
jgi:dTDP-L-rhamnose 4-epimerase